MKKSDLKTGMWLVCKNGDRGMVLLDTYDGDIISGDTNWTSLDTYNNDLKAIYEDCREYDIVKVIQPTANMYYYNIDQDKENIIWEREEEKEEKVEPINVIMNVTINAESVKDVKNIINELQSKLNNLKVGMSLS